MNHLGTKTLETERLILRKTIESDYEYMFYNWANDERVTKYLTWHPYESAQQLRDTYHKYLLESQTKSDVEYIGEACKIARKYFRMVGIEIYPVNVKDYKYLYLLNSHLIL